MLWLVIVTKQLFETSNNAMIFLFPQTIGNHEFDHGPAPLAPFLDAIESPIVLANVDLTDEPQLQGKFLNSTVLIRNGRKIGVIGVIANDTYVSTSTKLIIN